MTQGKAAVGGWKHDDLAADLAAHLRSDQRMVWLDMQLGPSGSPRPDVFTLEKSYSKPRPTAYECKISRSDLRSDTTSGKWQSYLRSAGSVTFAVPDGLATAADIPAQCGLIVRKAATWRHVRKATVQPCALPMDACMKLLIDGVGRVSHRVDPRPRSISLWQENEVVRKKFGAEVAACARDLVAAQQRLADARTTANTEWDRMRNEVSLQKASLIAAAKSELETWGALRGEVCAWLGLPANTNKWAVEQRRRKLKTDCDADGRVVRAESEVERARRAIEGALQTLSPRVEAA